MSKDKPGLSEQTTEEIIKQALLSDHAGVSEIQSMRLQTVLLTQILGALERISGQLASSASSPKAGE